MDMNLTFGNTVIVLGEDQIPLKQLKPAQQVLVFKKGQSLDDIEEDRCVNKIKTMVLSSVEGQSLYVFSCMEVSPSVDIVENTPENEEEPTTFEIESASMENDKEYHEGYLVCEDKVLKIESDRWIHDTWEEDINAKEEEEEEKDLNKKIYIDRKKIFVKHIFNKMMVEYDNKFCWYQTGAIDEENKTVAYFYKPLNKDAALVLMKTHNINPKYRHWSVSENSFLMLRSGKILNINEKFNTILNFIPEVKFKGIESDLDKFKEICSFDTYDIENYFENPSKIDKMNEFFRFNPAIWNKYHDMGEYFKPVFEMGEYKSYITLPTKEYNDTLTHYKNDKYMNPWSEESKDPDFKKYTQIAYQAKEFLKAGDTGVNPRDGMIYKVGKLDDQSKITYRDAELIEMKDGWNNTVYYGLYKNHFRILNKHDPEDIELIKEGADRRKVMAALSGAVI